MFKLACGSLMLRTSVSFFLSTLDALLTYFYGADLKAETDAMEAELLV